jgi:hypothetical protein
MSWKSKTFPVPDALKGCLADRDSTDSNVKIRGGVVDAPMIFTNPCTLRSWKRYIELWLTSLTISETTVHMVNLDLRCRIIVTNGGVLIGDHGVFRPFHLFELDAVRISWGNRRNWSSAGRPSLMTLNFDPMDSTVLVCNSSHSEFYDCRFFGSAPTSLTIRANSKAILRDCTFANSSIISLLVFDDSRVNLRQCFFQSTGKSSLLLNDRSEAKLKRCLFGAQPGPAMFVS